MSNQIIFFLLGVLVGHFLQDIAIWTLNIINKPKS